MEITELSPGGTFSGLHSSSLLSVLVYDSWNPPFCFQDIHLVWNQEYSLFFTFKEIWSWIIFTNLPKYCCVLEVEVLCINWLWMINAIKSTQSLHSPYDWMTSNSFWWWRIKIQTNRENRAIWRALTWKIDSVGELWFPSDMMCNMLEHGKSSSFGDSNWCLTHVFRHKVTEYRHLCHWQRLLIEWGGRFSPRGLLKWVKVTASPIWHTLYKTLAALGGWQKSLENIGSHPTAQSSSSNKVRPSGWSLTCFLNKLSCLYLMNLSRYWIITACSDCKVFFFASFMGSRILCWDVAGFGSLPAGLRSLEHWCVSTQACHPERRSTPRGNCQILLCTQTLHQPHYKAEVSDMETVRLLLLSAVQLWHVAWLLSLHRYGKRDIPDTMFSDLFVKESTETIPGSSYGR